MLTVYVSLQILIELTDLCKSEDCAHEQRLLRNMGAHTVVLEFLQVPYNKVGGWVEGVKCDGVFVSLGRRGVVHVAHLFEQ